MHQMRAPFVMLTLALLMAAPAPRARQAPDFSALREAAAGLPQLYSMIVSRGGQTLFEYYARGHGPARLANVKSASKSVIATLVGIAIDRGLVPGLDEPIVRWFPELRQHDDPRKRRITVEDL